MSIESKKLYRRAEIALEDGCFQEAEDFVKRVLSEDSEYVEAWMLLLLIQNKCQNKKDLILVKNDWTNSECLHKILSYGNKEQKEECEKLKSEWWYHCAKNLQGEKRFEEALSIWNQLGDYEDSRKQAKFCVNEQEMIQKAKEKIEREILEKKEQSFEHTQTGEKTGQKELNLDKFSTKRLHGAQARCQEYENARNNKLNRNLDELILIAEQGRAVLKEEPSSFGLLGEKHSFWHVWGGENSHEEYAYKLYQPENACWREGLPWDEKLANYWTRKSANTGNKEALVQMGHFYECGVGEDANIVKAADSYRRAGNQEECWMLETLLNAERKYTLEHIEKAESASPVFKENQVTKRFEILWKLYKEMEVSRLKLDIMATDQMEKELPPSCAKSSVMKTIGETFLLIWELLALGATGYWFVYALFLTKNVDLRLIMIFGGWIVSLYVIWGPVYLISNFFDKMREKSLEPFLSSLEERENNAKKKVYDDSNQEFQELKRLMAATEELKDSMNVQVKDWKHAYLLYYGAGVCGAETIEAAESYAANRYGKYKVIYLQYQPAEVIKKLEAREGSDSSINWIDMAKQFSRGNSWEDKILALECLIYYATTVENKKFQKYIDACDMRRTDPEFLKRLQKFYVEKEYRLAEIPTQIAAEFLERQYKRGMLVALDSLVKLYRNFDNNKAKMWAKKALDERCPDFAELASYCFRAGSRTRWFTRNEVERYAKDLKRNKSLTEMQKIQLENLLLEIETDKRTGQQMKELKNSMEQERVNTARKSVQNTQGEEKLWSLDNSVNGLSAMPAIIYDSSNRRYTRVGIFGDHAEYSGEDGDSVTIWNADVSGSSAQTSAGGFHW